MRPFSRSTSGRLLSVAFAFAFVGGGASGLMEAPSSYYVMSLCMITAIALAIVGVALSLEEFPELAALNLIALPFALFLYGIGLSISMSYHVHAASYLFVVAGAGFLALALRPAKSVEALPHAGSSRASEPA